MGGELPMSKLSERIRKVTRAEAAPIGFAAASRKPTPTMLLLARYPAERADKAKEAIDHGADVLLLEGNVSQLKRRPQELAQASVGLHLAALDAKAVAELKDASLDFAVFDAQASAAEVLLDEQLGFVLALGQDPTDMALRVMESLPLDALLVPPLQGPFTIQRQLDLKRLFLLTRTPLLMEVGADAAAAHLRCLRDAGVVGVIVDGGDGRRLAQVRQAIDGLPSRGRRREERAEAILPAAPITAAAEEEEEEEYP